MVKGGEPENQPWLLLRTLSIFPIGHRELVGVTYGISQAHDPVVISDIWVMFLDLVRGTPLKRIGIYLIHMVLYNGIT